MRACSLSLTMLGVLGTSGCSGPVESDAYGLDDLRGVIADGETATSASALTTSAFAEVFQDHMVLQRDMVIPVWGTGIEGKKVSVVFQGKWYVTYVRDGKWKVWMNPAPAGGPYDLKLITNDGADRVTLGDIMLGDVYIAGGQSNMTFDLHRTTNGSSDAATSNYPNVRHLTLKSSSEGWLVWKPMIPDDPNDDVWGSAFFDAVPFYFSRELNARLNVPIGILELGTPGTKIESWISAEALAAAGRREVGGDQWTAKIAPVATLAIRGVLWYQGEGSSGSSSGYEALERLLIQSWREAWNGLNIPFLVVQLPNHAPKLGKDPTQYPTHTDWAYTRQFQMNVYNDPAVGNTHLAVAIDAGDCYDLHPPSGKDTIGLRLAQGAKKLIYGSTVYYQGPIVRGVTREGSSVVLTYNFADKGMVSVNPRGDGTVSNFEVRDATDTWYAASAKLRATGSVEVVPPAGVTAKGVRYAFLNCPSLAGGYGFGVDLVNGVGYPALPFQDLSVP